MARYETIIITNPHKEKESAYVVSDIEYLIQAAGGTYSTEKWGRRKLAYPIQGFNYGVYTLIDFEIRKEPTKFVDRLQKYYDKEENIIKHIIVKKD